MQLDLDSILKFTNLGLSIAAMIYAFFATRGDRMDRHEARIAKLEHTVQSLPAKEDVHKLQLQLVRMEGMLSKMDAVMEGNAKVMARMDTIVTRHEDHLLGGHN